MAADPIPLGAAGDWPQGWRNPTPGAAYDLLVIGGGPAGLAAAETARLGGASVALVEQDTLGGVSLASGAVPSKAIIRTARLYAEMRSARRFGAEVPAPLAEDPSLVPSLVMERLRRLRARIGSYHSPARLTLVGVDLYAGAARFAGPDAVWVGDTHLGFRHALIATGARPNPHSIPGLDAAGYDTSETLFRRDTLPRRLMVIGGGPLGCETAQSFARLGVHVAIVQNEPKFLPGEERDAAQLLSDRLAQDGVEIHLNSTAVAVRLGPGGEKQVEVVSDCNRIFITVDDILLSAGRVPNVEDLDLARAGVRCDAAGVAVDDYLATSNPRVYAAGDVCLAHKFTHAAAAAGTLAAQNALWDARQRWSARVIPWCTYTDPEVARVGLCAPEARARGIPVKTFTVLMHDVVRAMLDGEQRGFVKIHVREGSDEILGATIVAAHAGEMINEITLAMQHRLGLGALAEVVHAYPTQANAIKMAARAWRYTRLPAAQAGAHDVNRPDWPADPKEPEA